MATRAEYEALAKRVETEEPGEDLRYAVLMAFGWKRRLGGAWKHTPSKKFANEPDPLHSLDAAASLVGDRPYVLRRMPSGRNMATIPAGKDVVLGKTKNPPAAALTAAALRARAQEANHD